MYLKYSTGFLIASLIQAGIILTTEALSLSTLGAKLTPIQLLTHIIAGQILGYILLFVMRKRKSIGTANLWVIGGITGITAWVILLTANSALGKVKAPWTEGWPTILFSILAFLALGLIAAYTIKIVEKKDTRRTPSPA